MYLSKIVNTHPDIQVTCTNCEKQIQNGYIEWFTNLAGPGFCNTYCLRRYFKKKETAYQKLKEKNEKEMPLTKPY